MVPARSPRIAPRKSWPPEASMGAESQFTPPSKVNSTRTSS
jgi:hypothetical protein